MNSALRRAALDRAPAATSTPVSRGDRSRVSFLLGDDQTQPRARESTRQASAIFAADKRVIGRRNAPRRSVCRLSKVATQAVGIPSAGPRGSSLVSPRMVRVQAATTTAPIRSATGSRVSTRTGRSPPGVVAHQTSPLTTAACRSRRRDRRPVPARRHREAVARTGGRRVRTPAGTGTAQRPGGLPRIGKHGWWGPTRRAAQRAPRAAGPRPDLSYTEYTIVSDMLVVA